MKKRRSSECPCSRRRAPARTAPVPAQNTWRGAHLRRSSSPTPLLLLAGRHGSDDPADTSRQRGHGPSGDNLFPAKTLIDRNPSTPLPVPFAVAHRGPARSGEASPGLAATGTGQPRAPCRGTGEHQLSPANAGSRLIPAGRGVGISGSRHGGGSACAGGGSTHFGHGESGSQLPRVRLCRHPRFARPATVPAQSSPSGERPLTSY
jgi:hypothetical protein